MAKVSGPPALVASWMYISTLAPGVLGLDSAELVTGAYTLGIVHPTGYPLFLILGKLATFFPIGSIAYRVNLLSALSGILTIGVLALIIFRLTKSILASWAGGLLLAIANTYCSMATVAEVYTLHTLILALLIYLALQMNERRWSGSPYMIMFVAGLGLSNHITTVLALPFIFWIMGCRIGLKGILRTAPGASLALAIGLLPYLYLPIRFAADPPLNYVETYYGVDLSSIEGLWWMATGQAYRFFAFGYDLDGYLYQLGQALLLLLKNFGAAGMALALVGGVFSIHRDRGTALPIVGILAANLLFFSGYAVVDKETMFLPTLLILAIFAGLGASTLVQLVRAAPFLLQGERTLLQYAMVLGLFCNLGLLANARWDWMDRSESYGPKLLAERVFETVPTDSVVIAKWSTAVVLEYYQIVEGQRPDLVIFNRSRYEVATYYNHWSQGLPLPMALRLTAQAELDLLRILGRDRAIYDLVYDPELARDYEYRPLGFVFLLKPRDPSQG